MTCRWMLALSLTPVLACAAPDGGAEDSTSAGTDTDTESDSGSETGLADLPPADHYYVFLAGPFDGDLVGLAGESDPRTAADELCAAEYASTWETEIECASASALLATKGGGAPATAPVDYALEPSAELRAANTDLDLGTVADVFGGSLSLSLAAAGLFPDDVQDHALWTGANGSGNYGSLACLDWSSADAAEQALAGDGDATTGWWSGASVSCASGHALLCLCH